MRRLLALAGLAAILLVACGGTDRPEGAVERWLISLNQGKAGEPQKYAVSSATNAVFPNWRECDPGSLDVIEVGRHGTGTRGGTFVPYRIKYASDLTSCDTSIHPSAPLEGAARVVETADGWRVVDLQTRSPAGPLRVPSEGGAPIGNAPAGTWLLTIAASIALMSIIALVIRRQPEPAPLPTEGRP